MLFRSLGIALVFALLGSSAAYAQYDQDPDRYPGMNQGDTTPGSPNLPQDLELTIAAGVATQPEYNGSDDYEAVFIPSIDLEYKQHAFLVINRKAMMVPYEGLGMKLLANQDFSAGINANYDPGRDDDSDFIQGIGEMDWTATLGGFAVYHPGVFFARAQIDQDVLGEYDGYKGELGIGATGPLNPYWRGYIEGTANYAGENYQEAYFGVSNAQSANTGSRVLPYDPDGGFYQYGLTGILQYNLTPGAFIQGVGKVKKLTGDAADSTITQDDTNYFLGTNVGYKF